MSFAAVAKYNSLELSLPLRQIFYAFLLSIGLALAIHAQVSAENENTIVIDEVKDTEVFAFGKNVVVKKEVKGVLVFGGDLIVEGKVAEDAATIGGSIYQKENAFIGGDVIILGGKYQSEKADPLRNPDKETVMYAGYEEELRELTQHPAQLFAPTLSWSYLAWRLLSTLIWFVVALIITTVAPTAVSRAVARFQLSTLKIVGIGLLAFITVTLGLIAGWSLMPPYLSGLVGLLAAFSLILAYIFGRVTLQVSFGKWLQKRFLPKTSGSESVALLLGAFCWTLLTSIPYFGNFAVLLLFTVSLGLLITARAQRRWQRN